MSLMACLSVPLLLGTALQPAWSSPQIRVLASLPTDLERGCSGPLHLLECSTETGGFAVEVGRYEFGIPFRGGYRLWSVRPGPAGSTAVTPLEAPGDALSITTSELDAGSDVQYLVAVDGTGDTLWTCRLEGTDEFCQAPLISSDGTSFVLCIHPDCSDDRAGVYRVSGSGEMVFSRWISNTVLLGLSEVPGESSPTVESVDFLGDGDLLLSGRVSEWMTTPSAWFVCRLDGTSGEIEWNAFGFGLGEAWANDAVPTSSGVVVAVGGTREIDQEDIGLPPLSRGETFPLLLVISDSGEVVGSVVLERNAVKELEGIIATGPGSDRFFVTGSDAASDRAVLLEMEIPVDPETRAASGPSVFDEER